MPSAEPLQGGADLIYRIVLIVISPHFSLLVVMRLMALIIAVHMAVDPAQFHHVLAWFTASPRHWITGGGLSAGLACAIYGITVMHKHRLRQAAGNQSSVVAPQSAAPETNDQGMCMNGAPDRSDRSPATTEPLHR
jgi:hypothetical protein